MTRRWLLWLVFLMITALIISRFTDLESLLAALATGVWEWVLAAVALHLLYYFLYALMYHYGFATVEVESRVWDLLPVFFATYFVNAVAPSGGAGAAVLFIDDAVRRGQSGARTATGTVLVLIVDLVTLIPFLVYGTLFLAQRNALESYVVIGIVFFLIFAGGLIGALILARWQAVLLHRLLWRLQNAINRLGSRVKRPLLLARDWHERTAAEFTEAIVGIIRHPDRLGYTLLVGLLLHIVNLAGLYALFLTFREPVSLGVMAAGFSIGIVFFVITVVPEGVGAVEGVMALIFTALGVPSAKAIAIIIIYRGFNFFLPLLIGALLLRRMRAFGVNPNR